MALWRVWVLLMASVRWDLYLVPGAARTLFGDNVHIGFKAYQYEAGEAHWELQTVFVAVLGPESEEVQLCRVHRANRLAWEHGFEKFLGKVDGVRLPSLTSCKASGQHDPAGDPFIRQEYTISSAGLFALLLNMAQTRKLVMERERSFAVLVAWLSTTLAFEPAAAICRGALPESAPLPATASCGWLLHPPLRNKGAVPTGHGRHGGRSLV